MRYRVLPSLLVSSHLRYNLDNLSNYVGFIPSTEDRGLSSLFYGKFKSIISAIYHSDNPVDLCSAIGLSLSEHVSPDVQSFVSNFLLKAIPAVKGAPDDETAFNTIIPRDCYTRSRIAPYLDRINEFIKSETDASTNPTD